MISKLLFLVTIINLWFGTNFELPRDDLIILDSGEKIEGHIESITDGLIKINIKGGKKTIVREINIYSPRDIVEIGIISTKRNAGHINYLGTNYMEMKTSSGKLHVKRAKIRKIIISQESTLPPLDL